MLHRQHAFSVRDCSLRSQCHSAHCLLEPPADPWTQAPTLTAPSGRTTTPLSISYSLPEAAYPQSVVLMFVWLSGVADTSSPHNVTLLPAFETAGAHSFSLTSALGNSGTASVLSVHSGGAANVLVDGATYEVLIGYRGLQRVFQFD